MICIGIDPGLETGWAEWNTETREFTVIETLDFWRAVRMLEAANPEKIVVYIEDPGLNKFTYSRNRGGDVNTDLKVQRNVGSNAREATLLIELCGKLDITCIPVRPTRRKITNVHLFALQTKYARKTSQHGRDAAMLVVGR
jgi:hypothetical protein